MRNCHKFLFFAAILFAVNISVLHCETDPDDFAILDKFRKGLDNPELLKWPTGSKDPCGEKWPHVYCSGSRIGQIQVQKLGLSGTLPPDLNKLTELVNVGLQNNNFSGPMPSFNGLSKIQYIFLDNNQFNMIPADFFVGLTSLQVLQLSNNPLNKSTGWMLPKDIQASAQITKIYLIECNLIGPIPEFLGSLNSLTVLEMSYNKLSGPIPTSFNGSALQDLWLNNQDGPGLSGTIDLIGTMPSLTTAWLHGNAFTGTIPSSIGELSSLQELWLNNNQLVGLVPDSLANIRSLQSLRLDNNKLMGPIPKMGFGNFSYSFNSFCQETPGVPCAPEVMVLLEFLGGVNYPLNLASSWSGNDPCSNNWLGVSCSADKVSIINLPNANLNGTLSPSLGKLDGLVNIRLGGNNLEGTIPSNLTSLKSLKLLNVSSNNLGPPVPTFSTGVTLLTDGNPLLDPSAPKRPPPPASTNPPSSPGHSSPPPGGSSSGGSDSSGGKENHSGEQNKSGSSKKLRVWIVIVSIIVGVIIILLILVVACRWKRKKGTFAAASSIVVHPKDPSDPDNMVKIVVANNATHSTTASDLHSATHSGATESHLIESGNFVVSVQILREVTRNFSPENEVGRGGFGVVYKGELYDGTMVAVKRMESAVISNKGLDEFQAEIAVLSKVRHRNLVSLLGYSVEGNEKLLVYEYMPKGALSKHLFEWKKFNLEPLSWKKRLNIALDVARGMEYLHNLAHHCFIHRDLKSSNILLGDDYRAKVSDFGLVKLAPHGKTSVVTRLAGTFGYLAPEYAVTGKITTKADVFSFGVVLMELLTGLKALDESRSEEKRYLASWFCSMKSNKEKLRTAIDETLDVTDETFEIICILAELAGHCAAREPYQRPDMGHAVNVLAPLVEKWKPANDDQDEYLGIDLGQPLLQMVKGWQAAEGMDASSSMGLDDSKGSIPARPVGFAESFTSADGR